MATKKKSTVDYCGGNKIPGMDKPKPQPKKKTTKSDKKKKK